MGISFSTTSYYAYLSIFLSFTALFNSFITLMYLPLQWLQYGKKQSTHFFISSACSSSISAWLFTATGRDLFRDASCGVFGTVSRGLSSLWPISDTSRIHWTHLWSCVPIWVILIQWKNICTSYAIIDHILCLIDLIQVKSHSTQFGVPGLIKNLDEIMDIFANDKKLCPNLNQKLLLHNNIHFLH